ncbi:MAG: N-acetyltransferase family protein [Omnitrophica WOR_2 bacterium]
MNSKLFTRPLHLDDAERILEVYRQCEDFLALGPVPHASLEMVLMDLHHSLDGGRNFVGVYLLENSIEKLVGVVDYQTAGFEGSLETAFIELLMIAFPYRSKGIGTEIVQRVETEIRNHKQVNTIQSGVQANNPIGIRFWTKMGYQIVCGPELMPDQTIAYRIEKSI